MTRINQRRVGSANDNEIVPKCPTYSAGGDYLNSKWASLYKYSF